MDSSHNKAPTPVDALGVIERFLKVFRHLWIIPVILAILLGARDYFSGQVHFSPLYRSECLFSVGSSYDHNDIFSGGTFYSDSAAAQTMAKTFPDLLSMEYMQDLIVAQLEDGYINGSISADYLEGTNLVQLSVTSSDPQDAYDILNAVLAAYPQAAVYLVDNPTIQIRQEPKVPTEPVNQPVASRDWTGGAVKGLALGLLIIAGLSLLNQTVSNADELKKLINLPILGKLPQVTQRKRRKAGPVLISAESNPRLAEAMRSLRTKVRKAAEQAGGNVILLTSTVPGEGKTTISCNLAQSLAAEGHRVILVDADLRKQSVLRLFAPKEVGGKGLLYCLHNPQAPLSEAIRQLPGSDLHYISGGSTQKRHYSIDPKAMNRIIGELSETYDYVVIDTPPCGIVSDTRSLCRYAHCILYVVKIGGAHRMLISDSITALHQQGVTISGCIANSVPRLQTRDGYGYGYSKKYGKQ